MDRERRGSGPATLKLSQTPFGSEWYVVGANGKPVEREMKSESNSGSGSSNGGGGWG